MEDTWDCIIVGAGIMGSWAAYHLAKQGTRTLLLEQFVLPHSRGGSNGQSRIIRMAYDKDYYTAMMPDAYRWWRNLEAESGKELLVQTGLVKIQGGDQQTIKRAYDGMKRQNVEAEMIDGAELRRRYPYLHYPPDHAAVVDPSGGLLLPPRCLHVLQDIFVKAGGTILDGVRVEDVEPGPVATVVTSKGRYRARRLILTAGPWAKDLLAKVDIHVPMKTMPGRVAYWPVSGRARYYTQAGSPIVVHWYHGLRPGHYRQVYMIPSHEYPGMVKTMPGLSAYWQVKGPVGKYSTSSKVPIILHHFEPPVIPQGYRFIGLFPSLEYPGMVKIVTRGEPPPRYVHPDARDRDDGGEMIALISDYITKHFPDIDNKPSIVEPCVYSMTPDSDYIIDRHPRHPNIVYGCGFSGHGFKIAPVVGKILVDMAEGRDSGYDISHFRVNRDFTFNSKL